MKHAGAVALDALEPLLEQLRPLPMKEKSRGVFYYKSQAFLHFHEDPKGLFADLRNADGSDFDRFDVTTGPGQDAFAEIVTARLTDGPTTAPSGQGS